MRRAARFTVDRSEVASYRRSMARLRTAPLPDVEARAALASATLDDLLVEAAATLEALRALPVQRRQIIGTFTAPSSSLEGRPLRSNGRGEP